MRQIQFVLLAIVTLPTACGDGGTGPSPTGLADSWIATEMEFTSLESPGLKIEVVALGASGVLTLAESGSWTLVITQPGEPPLNRGGTWSASSEVLTLNVTTGFTGQMEFDMTLVGNVLTLSGAHVDFDVDGNGDDEAATLSMVLTRQ
jgi:hypothetical protein